MQLRPLFVRLFLVPLIQAASYNLRYVARNLRYLPLADLVGKTVTLQSLRTASDDVIRQIGPKLAGLTYRSIQNERHIETQFAKYAFWDSAWQEIGRASCRERV